jgi:hypothetical protein
MRAGGGRDLLLILLLALAPVLAYSPAWHEGRLLAPGDGAALHLPLRSEAWRALLRGELPSWNASIFSGTPLLAAYRPGVFHPLMAALAPLQPFVAFQLLVLASLALTGPLTFLYARWVGAEAVGALVAGVAFALGPYLVNHLGDTPTVVAAPALPLVLLALERHLRRGGATIAVALALALLVLAGSPEAVGAGALLIGARLAVAYGVPFVRGRRVGGAAGVHSTTAALVAGILLAGPQIVPTLVAWREAGASATDAAGPPDWVLTGVSGLVVRYVSHTPAPVLALAAVPLALTDPVLRATAGAVVALLVLFGLRGRFEAAGALPLAFDFVLALLAGLSLSVQWRARQEPGGRRLRLLAAVAALCAAAALSVATSVSGPLPQELAAPVGLLALSFILYFTLAEAVRPVAVHVFLLPLVASFLLQPWGRKAWQGAPTPEDLDRATPTREALDRVMGARRDERTLTLVESWPRQGASDLAWANLAAFAGRRNANGYDPLVPAIRGAVFDGMRADGTLPRSLLETDPGRLELLGVRWIQVPTATLAAPADADGLGEELDVVLEPARPHLFALPYTHATEVRVVSFLAGATAVPQGAVVAECLAQLATGREIWLPLRAGIETAEWAYERPDVLAAVRHERARIHRSFPVREGFLGHRYLATLPLPGRFDLVGLRFRALPGTPPLWVLRVGIRDGETGRAAGVSLASAYLSDEVRLTEAALTPLVSLFEVRRGVGRAWVVESLRRLPDARHLQEVLRAPTRLGVDARREALAVVADVEGVAPLPPGARASPADLARAVGGRLVVRAQGAGLLVVGEGWDAGWTARVDGRESRVLRVNGDRLGLVLSAGTHRVVLNHRTRGLRPGLALAALAAVGLVATEVRERRRRPASARGARV